MSGESSSRTDISIPDVQKELLKALVATGKPVVLLLFNGRPLTLNWEAENVPAILDVWFGGSEAADAVADLLFGEVNPSGKLTMTFPKNVGQIPIYYAAKNTGRPLQEGRWFEKFRSNYLDVDNQPLYPFGYGLSYTTFEYGPVTLNAKEIEAGETVKAEVVVRNTGKVAGKEVVQMYIQDVVGSTTRPVRELKGFQKIYLEPGESKIVSFEITPELISHYNSELNFVAEPGEFVVYIGGDSQTQNSSTFILR
jgi:beta-glucosidase